MRIKHVNGGFWNEDSDCFGPVQAATEYDNTYDVPTSIDNGTLQYEEGFYWAYNEAVASVVQS